MKFFILLIFILNLSVYAQDSLEGIKISREEILISLDNLKKDGKISEDDYLKAKKELGLMGQDQIDSLNKKALDIVKKDPTKQAK